MSIFSRIFGSKSDRDLKTLKPIVKLVNEQESWAKSLSKEEFLKQTEEFKRQIQANETTLDEILPKSRENPFLSSKTISRAHVKNLLHKLFEIIFFSKLTSTHFKLINSETRNPHDA